MHGETQNANELFNNVIWTKCPKNVFINKMTLELGVYSAVLQYTLGTKGVQEVISSFGLRCGVLTEAATNKCCRRSVCKVVVFICLLQKI